MGEIQNLLFFLIDIVPVWKYWNAQRTSGAIQVPRTIEATFDSFDSLNQQHSSDTYIRTDRTNARTDRTNARTDRRPSPPVTLNPVTDTDTNTEYTFKLTHPITSHSLSIELIIIDNIR